MCECGVATGSCVQILDFITERGSCYVVAAGNLRTDFRFWCRAAKLDVNGFPLRGDTLHTTLQITTVVSRLLIPVCNTFRVPDNIKKCPII